MNRETVYVLVHSPLVGSLTWKLVARQMQQRNLDVLVPALVDQPGSHQPFWQQHAGSASQAVSNIPNHQSITLVAHSGAGPLLPAIRQSIANPVNAYLFIDAGVPRDGASRLDLMKAEDPEWADEFQKELERGSLYPSWGVEDLSEVIPDEPLRRQMIAEMRPRGLSFFTEPIPVFSSWPDAPCIYINFSTPYQKVAANAREAGWPTYTLEAGHFHMMVDAEAVTNIMIATVQNLKGRRQYPML